MNYYRVGDVLPVLDITVLDAGVPINLTSLTVYVRWQRPDQTLIAERTATKTAPAEGRCTFAWQVGDLTVPGVYRAIIQLAPTADTSQRQSLEQPPDLYVEVLPNDFGARDVELDAVVPIPTAHEVAMAMNVTAAELESDLTVSAIERARRLAYVHAHINRLGALSTLQTNMLRDLVAQLAAMLLTSPPSVTYGPYQREQMAAYSYEVRGAAADGLFGIPPIDALITYFRDEARGTGLGIAVAYPEWWQPVTERLVDPSRQDTVDL